MAFPTAARDIMVVPSAKFDHLVMLVATMSLGKEPHSIWD